jgi:hypothetical protein
MPCAATLHRWWGDYGDPRQFDEVLEVLPRPHVTLVVIDRPAEHVSHDQLHRPKTALLDHLAHTRPIVSPLRWGPAVVHTVAVEL